MDWLLLPHVHPSIPAALEGGARPRVDGALGVLELLGVAATLRAADAALKAADTVLVALHLARGVGGKGYFAFAGDQHAVEAALEAGELAVAPELRAGYELIARPHDELQWVVERL